MGEIVQFKNKKAQKELSPEENTIQEYDLTLLQDIHLRVNELNKKADTLEILLNSDPDSFEKPKANKIGSGIMTWVFWLVLFWWFGSLFK